MDFHGLRDLISFIIIRVTYDAFAVMMKLNRSKAMSFDEKYRLLDLIEDGSAQTFVAEEIATGKKVNVFLFVGEQASAQAQLLEQLNAADSTTFPELIETGKNNDTSYVVTQLVGGFADLKMRAQQLGSSSSQAGLKQSEFSKVGVWRIPKMQQKQRSLPDDVATPPSKGQSVSGVFQIPAQPQPPQPSLAPSPPEPVPGEFTRLFQSAGTSLGEETAEPKTLPLEPAPGEFTRLFQAPAAPIGESALKTESPQSPSQPQPAPGEFTRLFQTAPAPPSGQISAPQKSPDEGQFTRIFGKGTAGPVPQESGGQFTGIFQSQTAAVTPQQPRSNAPDTPPPAYSPSPGEFTQIFGSPSTEAQTQAAETPAPESPMTPAAPGEYTRMFSAQPVIQAEEPAPTPPAAPPAESASPTKKTSNLPLILGGIILLLLILIAVLLITTK